MIIWTDTVKCYLYGPTKTHIIIVNEACTSHDVRSTIAFQRILTLRHILFYESFLLKIPLYLHRQCGIAKLNK